MKLKSKIFIFAGLLLHACAIDEVSHSSEDVFEFYWHEMDKRYVYFGEKGVNWDSLYAVYRPQVSEKTTDRELFDIIAQMIEPLKDSHLFVRYDTALYNYPLPHSERSIENSLGYYQGKQKRELQRNRYSITQLNNAVTYLNLFDLNGSLMSPDTVYNDLSQFDYSNGIILNLKWNCGGNAFNITNIASLFFSGNHTIGYIRYKAGASHDSFSDYMPITLKGKGAIAPDIPIVIITSATTYSAANILTATMKLRPKTFQIGERTGGGGASRIDYRLPNGMGFSISEIAHFDINYKSVEGGVVPDFYVTLTEEEIRTQNYPYVPHKQIELALKLLSENASKE